MNIICHIKAHSTSRMGNNTRLWVRAMLDDGTYSEDVPVDIASLLASETTIQGTIRTTVASRMAALTGSLILATDIRLV